MATDQDKVVAIPLSWWDRIKRAVIGYEGGPSAGGSDRRSPLKGTGGVSTVVTALILPGSANGSGYYPANIVQKNSATGLWAAISPSTPPAVVRVADPNGAALVSGTRYSVVPSGIDPTDHTSPAFLVSGGAGSGSSYVNVTGPVAPSGYYPGTLDSYAAGAWTTGPAVSVKNLEGRLLAVGHRVVGFSAGLDGTTAAYFTEAGGFTGTKLGWVSQSCVNNFPVATVTTDTYINGVLISSV